MGVISDQRADILDAVARGILIEAAFLWMRPAPHILQACAVERRMEASSSLLMGSARSTRSSAPTSSA